MRRAGNLTIDQLAFAAVCVAVLMITWNGLRVAGGAVANVFLVLAFGAAVLRIALLRQPPPLPPWLLGASIGLAIAAMLTLIFPPDSSLVTQTLTHYRTIPQVGDPIVLEPRPNLLPLIQFLIGLAVIPLLIASVATTPTRIERLLDIFVIGAAVNAGVGLVDWGGFGISPIDAGEGRSAGLTVHPNYLALTCTIAIPLALLWIGRGGRWRTAGFLCVGLLLIGTVVSGSRAGAVTAVLGILVTLIAIPRLRSGLGFTVPAVGLAVLAIVFFAGDELLSQIRLGGDVSTTVNTTGSNEQRSQLIDLAIIQIEAKPLHGVGYSVIADAHSIYLQLLAAGGVIALISFLIYIGGLAGATMRAMAGPQRDVAAACGVSILMWLVNGVIDNQLGDKYLYVVPGLLIALSYVTSEAMAREPREPPPRRRQASPPPSRVREPAPAPGSAGGAPAWAPR